MNLNPLSSTGRKIIAKIFQLMKDSKDGEVKRQLSESWILVSDLCPQYGSLSKTDPIYDHLYVSYHNGDLIFKISVEVRGTKKSLYISKYNFRHLNFFHFKVIEFVNSFPFCVLINNKFLTTK